MLTVDLLAGLRVVTMALNLPGPAACARLREWGAEVVKVEPPSGDPFAAFCPDWYWQLHAGMEVHRVDLKADAGLARMHAWLARADVLVTAQRPSALDRLGLRGEALQARHPRLSHAQLTGHREPLAEAPGHDLTYLAEWDLVAPPAMPPTLFADMAGAERLVSGVLALVRARDRTGKGAHLTIALADAAEWLALPREHGLTQRGALLGGGFAGYNLYATRDGWIALAALEPHFAQRVAAVLQVGELTQAHLEATFAREPSAHWTAWSREHDIPLVALPSS
jgi:crotonobetainyl-CoA:carnitine CoA-transferase CaiB-like acyl-CoA transferase